MARSIIEIMIDARRQLLLDDKKLSQLTGVSLRTVERHKGNGGISASSQVLPLIEALASKNQRLAEELAAAYGTSLAQLGYSTPPSAPAPAPASNQPLPARTEHADSVLLAAAHAMSLPPEAIRPALAAAFARAQELGVGLDGLAEHLARPLPSLVKPNA